MLERLANPGLVIGELTLGNGEAPLGGVAFRAVTVRQPFHRIEHCPWPLAIPGKGIAPAHRSIEERLVAPLRVQDDAERQAAIFPESDALVLVDFHWQVIKHL